MADGPAPGGGIFIGIDASQHHSGNNSLRVIGGDSCGYYAINTSAFSKLGDQVYTRFYALFSGNAGTPDAGFATQNHNGFLSMYSGAPSGTDPNFYNEYNTGTATGGQLRIGSQAGVLDWNNLIPDSMPDSTLPDLDTPGEMESIDPVELLRVSHRPDQRSHRVLAQRGKRRGAQLGRGQRTGDQ